MNCKGYKHKSSLHFPRNMLPPLSLIASQSMVPCIEWLMSSFVRKKSTLHWRSHMTRMIWTPGIPRQLLGRSSIRTTFLKNHYYWCCHLQQLRSWLPIQLRSPFWMNMMTFQFMNSRRYCCLFKWYIKMMQQKNTAWISWWFWSLHWQSSVSLVLASLFDRGRGYSSFSLCIFNLWW